MTIDMRPTPHAMLRLDIPTTMRFDDFRREFEAAAPAVDLDGVKQLLADGGGWADIEAAAERNAPNGLMIYARIDIGRLMTVAGHPVKCVEYLLGNHVTAERMFRHDPLTALYAPLRVVVYSDADDQAVFSLDQPSSVFAGLDRTEISVVGAELDGTVARLLRLVTGQALTVLPGEAAAGPLPIPAAPATAAASPASMTPAASPVSQPVRRPAPEGRKERS